MSYFPLWDQPGGKSTLPGNPEQPELRQGWRHASTQGYFENQEEIAEVGKNNNPKTPDTNQEPT